jgi:hypothetical protein
MLAGCTATPHLEPRGDQGVSVYFKMDLGDGSNLTAATVEANAYCRERGRRAELIRSDVRIGRMTYVFRCM